ncbi:hypothetical protein ACPXCG_17910 [Gordonia sp. DT218]
MIEDAPKSTVGVGVSNPEPVQYPAHFGVVGDRIGNIDEIISEDVV